MNPFTENIINKGFSPKQLVSENIRFNDFSPKKIVYKGTNFRQKTSLFNTGKYIQKIQFPSIKTISKLKGSYKEKVPLAIEDEVKVNCTCPDFKYGGFKYIGTQLDYSMFKEGRYPKKRNPDLKGSICKHLNYLLENLPKYTNRIAKDMDINNRNPFHIKKFEKAVIPEGMEVNWASGKYVKKNGKWQRVKEHTNTHGRFTPELGNKLVEDLAKQYKVKILPQRFKSPSGRAWIVEREVQIPEVKDLTTLCTCLHEIKHIINQCENPTWNYREEFSAETWAIEKCKEQGWDPKSYEQGAKDYVLSNIVREYNKTRDITKIPKEIKDWIGIDWKEWDGKKVIFDRMFEGPGQYPNDKSIYIHTIKFMK